jgi:ubiquinone/menaquinone biosynthesis C-methylase UbiE
MTHATPEPLSAPLPWNLVAEGYGDILMPWFSRYAADAIELSGVSAPAAVLDVASGPGTLSLVAAARGLRVTAVDFAGCMMAALRRSAQSRDLRVEAVLADGESLPFPDEAFDAGFSMFGVIFFAIPARGLGEMLRVLKPGAPAVISTWQPLAETPLLEELFSAVKSEDGSLSFPEDELSLPGELESAMTEAGFIGVTTREAAYSLECSSLDDALERLARSTPPFPQLRQSLPPREWNRLWAGVRGRLAARFGEGGQSLRYPAWLAAGRKAPV